MPGGVTVGKPQDAPITSIPIADAPRVLPGVAVGGPEQPAQAAPVGGLPGEWKPTLTVSSRGPIKAVAAAATEESATKKAKWEKPSKGGWMGR